EYGIDRSDIRYILHTHTHIDHAGQDANFPMSTTVIMNRRELEFSASGIMGGQYPPEYVKHHVDRLHTPGALRLLDLELSGPDEIFPGIVSVAAGGPTDGLVEMRGALGGGGRQAGRRKKHGHLARRRREGVHLRRRDLRHPQPDRRPDLPGARLRAA